MDVCDLKSRYVWSFNYSDHKKTDTRATQFYQIFSKRLSKPTENQHPNFMSQPEVPDPAPPAADLQSENQPPLVQPVLNPSGPSNPAPDQAQPHGGKRTNVHLSVV